MAKRLDDNGGNGGNLVIASGATALPFPPTAPTPTLVPAGWNPGPHIGVVPELDVHFRAVDDVNITNATVYAGRLFALDLDDVAVTDADVNVSTNAFHSVAHPFFDGDSVVYQVDPGDTALSGLTDGTMYWIVVVDADHFKLSASLEDAFGGTTIDLDYGTKAELDLATLAAHNIDLVVEARLPGSGGEAITLDIVFDAPGAPTLSEIGNAVTLHAKNNVTTNAMLAAVLNSSTKLQVKTDTVTPGYVLQSATDNFAATALAVVTGDQGYTFATDADSERFHWSDMFDVGDFALSAQLAKTVTIPHRGSVIAYYVGATFSDTIEVSIEAEPVTEKDG